MQHAVLNRAAMRVAETTEVSGRVTAESIKHGFCAKKQSDLLRICASAIFGCVVSVGVLLCLVIRLLNNSDSFISHQVRPSRLVGSC